MAWTYFTAALDGSTPITKAQRDELFDAFLERQSAAGAQPADSFSIPTALRDSPIITDIIIRDSDSSKVRLLDAIFELSEFYFDAEMTWFEFLSTADPFFPPDIDIDDPSTVIGRAITSLGLSSSEFNSIYDQADINTASRWNLIRKALQKLEYVGLEKVSGISESIIIQLVRDDNPAPPPEYLNIPSWSDIKSEFASESPSSTASTSGHTSLTSRVSETEVSGVKTVFSRSISAIKSETVLKVPALDIFDSWEAKARGGQSTNPPNMDPRPSVLIELGSNTKDDELLSDNVFFDLFTVTDQITGNRTLSIELSAWETDSQLDLFEPDDQLPSPGLYSSAAGVSEIGAKPTWTHPAD